MLRPHRTPLLNWFFATGKIVLGAVDGLNNKTKVITRKVHGYRSFEVVKIAL